MLNRFNFLSVINFVFLMQICQAQTIFFTYDLNKNLIIKTKPGSGDHIVQNTNDSGTGSLRAIISDACPEDTVTFASILLGDTIKLTGPEIKIDRSLYLLGLHQDSLNISGENNSRIFIVEPNVFVGIEKMKLIKGNSPIDGGAILNQTQNLVLKNLVLEKNFQGGIPKAMTNKGHVKIEEIVIIKN